MKWNTIAAVIGSTAIVSNGTLSGIVAVRWVRNQPQLFGPVYSNRYDAKGNQIVDIIDPSPEL